MLISYVLETCGLLYVLSHYAFYLVLDVVQPTRTQLLREFLSGESQISLTKLQLR